MTGTQGGMQGGMPNGNVPEGMMQNREENNDRKEPQTGEILNENNGNESGMKPGGNMNAPENGESAVTPPSNNGSNMRNPGMMNTSNSSATNKVFKISGVSNQFSGVADYTESTNNESGNDDSNNGQSSEVVKDNTTANTILPQTGVMSIAVGLVIILGVLAVVFLKKIRRIKIK